MATANSTVARPRLNIDKEVAAMQRMTVDQLRARFAEVFGEGTNGRNKPWLIKRIAWRMQSKAEGIGLSERALARAEELANGADLRVTAPRQPRLAPDAEQRTKTLAAKFDQTVLLPGTMLERDYKGRTIRVIVRDDGFECEGERYKSLTAVAAAITGKHWNGFHFFGLRQKAGVK